MKKLMEIRDDSEITMKRMRLRITIPVVIAAALLLSACGSPSSSGPTTTGPSARTAYLCQVIPRVNRLVVTRHAPGRQFVFTFPAVVTVTSASAAQAVAKSACALPDAPKGAQACPAEFAVSYHLVFAVRGEKGMGGEAIDVNPTGCQSVTGLGTVREVVSHPAFYRLLGNAMGLKNPSYLTFTGAFRTGG
jgi:hypothetical protein